jgi:hypothetical protein
MLTLKYGSEKGIVTYTGEINYENDDLINLAVATRDGKPVEGKNGSQAFRSFIREQIISLRGADGKMISHNATL